jgi:HK97 family phage prohead protease
VTHNQTGEFKILSRFQVKDAAINDTTADPKVITISGCCNWSGQDDEGKTYTDLAGDVVVPGGVDASVWSVNPQILLQHVRDSTIGEGLSIEVRDDGLYIEAEIHQDALDSKDWYRIKTGLLRMFSIGFRTLAGEWREVDGKDVFFITRSLLLEVSVVSIPCNSFSGFSVIKSVDGAFGGSQEPVKQDQKTDTGESESMTVKVKYMDYLPASELDGLKAKGIDVEQEVEMSFVDLIKRVAGQEADNRIKQALDEFATKQAEEVTEEAPAGAADEVTPEGEAAGDTGEVTPEADAEEADAEEDAKAVEALALQVKKLTDLITQGGEDAADQAE